MGRRWGWGKEGKRQVRRQHEFDVSTVYMELEGVKQPPFQVLKHFTCFTELAFFRDTRC